MRILHAFNYPLKDINVRRVSEQGFDAIQISPLQPLKQKLDAWWLLYQPCGFTIGNDLGTKEELINLCNEAKKVGVKIILDVVINHVANHPQDHLKPHDKVDKNLLNADIWKERRFVENYEDRWQVVNWCIGMPSIDTSKKQAQDIIINFLLECVGCGVSGFRIDALKHIATVSEGNDFLLEFNKRLPKEVVENSYGEVIFSRKEILDEYAKYIKVLTEGCTTDRDKTVAFVESHDTFYEFKITNKMSDDLIMSEYDILCKNFNNTIFYARPFNNTWMCDCVKYINRRG